MIEAMKIVTTPEEKFQAQAKLKDPEEKRYLVLFVYTDDSDDCRSWEIVTGRTEARNIIIANIENIDVDESHILVEGRAFGTEISIYEFMKHVEDFYDDTFDIDDFVTNYEDEEDSNSEYNEEEDSESSEESNVFDAAYEAKDGIDV